MHTLALFCYSSSSKGARKGRKRKETKRKKKGRKRKIFARTTSSDDLREQIDRDAFAMRCYASPMLRRRRRSRRGGGGKREREKKKMAMFITCRSKSSLRKVQISSANAFNDNDVLQRERKKQKEGLKLFSQILRDFFTFNPLFNDRRL